jgi:microcystin-dependent protein
MQLTRDYIRASNGSANASLMTVQTLRTAPATTILVNTVAGVPTTFIGSMGTPHTFTDPVTGETITIISDATAVDFAGHVDSGHIEIDEIAPGYTDLGSKVGDIIVIRPVTRWADLLAEYLTPTGVVSPFVGSSAPTNWLLCDGANLLRADYPRLFNVIGTNFGSVDGTHFNVPDLRSRQPVGAGTAPSKVATFASRSGNVITVSGLSNTAMNEFQTGQAVAFASSGTTIGGLTSGTTYYLIRTGNLTFSLATTRANAVAGTAITLSSDGTGTRTFTLALTARALGETGGEERHSILLAEMASHIHANSFLQAQTNFTPSASSGVGASSNGTTVQAAGGSGDHNILNPYVALNYIIKT